MSASTFDTSRATALPADTELIVAERGGQQHGFVMRELAYPQAGRQPPRGLDG